MPPELVFPRSIFTFLFFFVQAYKLSAYARK
jgi:hypothetical protein